MFTGIVEDLGAIVGINKKKDFCTLSVRSEKACRGMKVGASIAVNGVCLTITRLNKATASFDVMKETLDKTNLGGLREGSKVNLERALKASDRLNGHVVTGHVDDVARLVKRVDQGDYTELQFSLSQIIRPFVVAKGSVCLDGVSLTVGKVTRNHFSVYLIPFTMRVTTLGHLKEGARVNVEADILAKYIKSAARR